MSGWGRRDVPAGQGARAAPATGAAAGACAGGLQNKEKN